MSMLRLSLAFLIALTILGCRNKVHTFKHEHVGRSDTWSVHYVRHVESEETPHLVLQFFPDGRVDFVMQPVWASGSANWKSLKKSPEEVASVRSALLRLKNKMRPYQPNPFKVDDDITPSISFRVGGVFSSFKIPDGPHGKVREILAPWEDEVAKFEWEWK